MKASMLRSTSSASSSTCSSSSAPAAQRGACPRQLRSISRRPLPCPPNVSVPNEADTLFKGIPLASGLINRRLMEKQMKKENKEFTSAMKLAEDDVRREQLLRRETRTPSTNEAELVEYFLNTVAEDMEFEVARCRPKLDDSFFRFLDNMLGQERFAPTPDEDRVLELEALRQYLSNAREALDQTVAKTSSAKERIAKLLSAKDKKTMILEMAEANEIDASLMALLEQNIQMARMAGQEDPAKFMEKVMQACAKFYVPPSAPTVPLPAGAPSAAAVPGQMQAVVDAASGAAAERPSIIIPGAAPTPRLRQSNMGVPIAPPSATQGGSSVIIPGR